MKRFGDIILDPKFLSVGDRVTPIRTIKRPNGTYHRDGKAYRITVEDIHYYKRNHKDYILLREK